MTSRTTNAGSASYHGRIMSMPDEADPRDGGQFAYGYKNGHRTARSDAAKIAAEADAEIARLRADALRYRWLIDTCGYQMHGKPSLELAWDDDTDDYRSATFWGLQDKESFDAAIDAAIAKGEGA